MNQEQIIECLAALNAVAIFLLAVSSAFVSLARSRVEAAAKTRDLGDDERSARLYAAAMRFASIARMILDVVTLGVSAANRRAPNPTPSLERVINDSPIEDLDGDAEETKR